MKQFDILSLLQQSSEKLKKQIKKLEKVKTTKKKHPPNKDSKKKPKIKSSKKSAVDQNLAQAPSGDKDNDPEPTQNAMEAIKDENSQEEGREQKNEKPKKVKKKVCVRCMFEGFLPGGSSE